MLSRKVSASLHPDLAGKLSPAHLHALHLLMGEDEPRIGQLARQLALDESTVTRLVDKLEGAGLAQRRPAPGDRRATVVCLTAKGEEALDSMNRRRAEFLGDILSGLEPDEQREFVRLTAKAAETLRSRADEMLDEGKERA